MMAAEFGSTKEQILEIMNFLMKIDTESEKTREFIMRDRSISDKERIEKEKKIDGLYISVFRKLGIK
jgi:hypothetical protein